MTQRDDTVGHVAGDEMTEDPIVVERHDEILGGPPVDDPEADEASYRYASARDEPARDEAARDEPAGGPNGDGIPAAALAGQRWPAIQAMFVDDPKGSVERAAAAADEAVKAFVAALQRQQTALRAAWEKDTSTEDLRTAFQQYRAFCGRLEGLA